MYNYKAKPQNVHRAILSLLIFLLFPVASQAQDGTLKWAIETEGMVYSSPAIGSDGTIYVGSQDINLYAINSDGNPKWKFETTRYSLVNCSPAIGSDGTIYVGSWDRYFYAINPDGTLKWAYFVENYVNYSSPAIGSDGTIYVGTYGTVGDKYLFAINSNGTLKWKFQVEDEIDSSPAIGADGTIYVGSNDNYLYAINPNGILKWKFLTTGDVYSSPAMDSDGTIYVGSNDKNLYAINPDGSMKWAFKTDGGVRSSPAIGSDGIIYVGAWEPFGNYLYAINNNGTLKWKCKTGTPWAAHSSPAIGSDGTIYVGSWYNINAINASSGGLASTPWPMFRHDSRHTGRSFSGTSETGNMVTSNLCIRAVINTEEKGPIEAVWKKGGEDTTSRGDRVIWGHFYASPSDVTWGSENNPDLFVKIWFDVSGRIDVNYFHVSVPDIQVYSDYPYDGTADQQGTTSMSRRYIRQYYEGGQSYSDENYEDGNPPSGYLATGNPSGYSTINNLQIGSMINTVEKGPIDAVWRLGGQDTTARGDQVVWGLFHVSPSDVTWGSQNNPDLFVKIWFDVGGRVDVNFFHVSVPDIEVYSDLPSDSTYDQKGTTIMDNRYIRHEYWR